MEGIQSLLLLGVGRLCLTPVQQCAEDGHCTLPLYTVLTESLVLFPHPYGEASECCCCLSYSLLELCVQGEVAANGGLKVRKLVHSFQLVVTNGNGNGNASTPCPRTFVFFKLIVSPKSLQALDKLSIRVWSSCSVWVLTAASSANSMSLIRTSLTFVLDLRRARSNRLPYDLVCR